ncbi:pro-neuregulin-3, membrane-bound isoform isoform X1 [Myxocyprinus asiaticus]|uniref:pro-neuregulin-3, membrane-bound isoform isoform X1 n=1 Tax=Myxocyprinus asiaticus TaxID=70543 RepID=UPI002221F4ED|nr:pro-neuregulin-3, membrane-bound isoform isoform X1 [Myxocyprinus asiaticus]
MSERTALGATMETMTLEEPGAEQASPRAPGPLRCGPCAVWPRQQTWLCVVPLLMGFVGLGLSLMLLKWIVVGSVQDYVPTDLVDANHIGQDPIFLSKPSALPKGPNGSTSTTSAAPSVVPGSATQAAEGTGTVQRTRIGQSSNHTASSSSSSGDGGALGGGSGNRAPHLHNRVGTQVTNTTTTTRTTNLTPPGGKEVTPRSTTVRKPNGEGGSRNASPSARSGPASTTTTSTTTTALTTGSTTTQEAQPTSTLASPTKPGQRWNHGRSFKGPSTKPTRPHHRFRTLAPTTSTVRSEFFKPCQDSQEMAFCLNEGECFIIETVAGVHRHCRCKEGYRGLRCDQFVPKTDSILSDPTADELGIEFMESAETYQRQILSIFSIAMGISLLGVACMALYCKNKRQREKHQAHLTEIRNLRDCTVSASGLMSKPSPRTANALQLQKSRTHGSSSQQAASIVFSSSKVSLPNPNRSLSTGKRCRSCSLSSSPSLKQKVTNYRAVSMWTPPISRAGYHLSGGSRDSINSYKHLQEVEVMPESLRRCQSHSERNQQSRSNLNMQIVVSAHSRGKMGYTDVPCTRLDQGATFPPPSIRAHSVPIIPSVQGPEFGEGPGEGGESKLHNRGRVSSSYNVINPETEVSVANFSQSLASSSVTVQEPHTLTCSESALMSRGQIKHKRLVTYTAALGSGMGSWRAKTGISMTVMGSGVKTTQYTTRLLTKATGGQGSNHVQSTFGATSGQEQGDGLQTPSVGEEKDSSFSSGVRGVACLTYPKS